LKDRGSYSLHPLPSKNRSNSIPFLGGYSNKKRDMANENLFIGEKFSEEFKLEIKFLYEIGVEIQDIEYLINLKNKS